MTDNRWDAIFKSEEDGLWYFWDETQSVLHGPFEDFDYASEARVRYVQHL